MSTRLRLTLACGAYDRTEALRSGAVRPEGIDLTYLPLQVEEIFFRMLRHREFDASEMSLSSYLLTLRADPAPFVAIPVFTSRAFRHQGVFVRSGAGIETPEDLVGRVVGTPEWQLTAGVWIRGILAEHHGVPVDSVSYRVGGLEGPGRTEKVPIDLPDGAEVQPLESDSLAEAIAAGEIDALYTPRTPSTFDDDRVRRLWPDVQAEEQRYWRETGIFPIMHVVVLRRELYDRHPWVARSLFDAFAAAKDAAVARLDEASALSFMLPWLVLESERTKRLLGAGYWSYGVESNRAVLETFFEYHRAQIPSSPPFDPEAIFVPECRVSHVI
jgi:4,5-dihydroxyphthalate decarboxylase